jgi:hypothetical protein
VYLPRMKFLEWRTIVFAGLVLAGCGPRLEPHPIVPAEHSRKVVNSSDFSSEPPAVRYRLAYESFYWNCVAIRLEDEAARCPFMCCGTPAASEGCRDGSMEAGRIVSNLFQGTAGDDARRLRSALMTADAQDSVKRYYFPFVPRREQN